MRAALYDRYGPPDVLRVEEVPVPTIGEEDVLVRVHAASINSWDGDLLTGTPFLFRLGAFLRPRYRTLGADIAGRVEAVGAKVTRFRVGDEVAGDVSAHGFGGFAEFVRAPERALCRKPPGVTFEEAAALPQAGAMAHQGLHEEGRLARGQRVLLNGAGGGVGTLAIQLAKAAGAHVTAVDRGEKRDTMRSLGADRVIDFTREDLLDVGDTYDLILDTSAQRSMEDYARLLRPGGTYVLLGGAVSRILELVSTGWAHARDGRRLRLLIARPNHAVPELLELVERGLLRTCIEHVYPLEEIAEAFRHFGTGQVHGKLVVRI